MTNDELQILTSARPITPIPSIHSRNDAKWMYERVVRSIKTFEESLDQEHEVGARLVSFGPELTFHIDDVSYWGPDMIMFMGLDADNKKVELLQHILQLNVLLIAVNKAREKPRQVRIDPSILERVDRAAKRLGISRSAFIVSSAAEKLERME